MDPFEVRMQFLTLLRRLNASQQSIQRVVGYALKYFSRCGEDIWDCVVEECQKGSINNRINILYFLDSLCEASLLAKSHPAFTSQAQSQSTAGPAGASLYVDYVSRDLGKIVDYVVPEGREGLLNMMSTKQILESWRTKRMLDPQKLDDALTQLDHRKEAVVTQEPSQLQTQAQPQPPSRSAANALPRPEIFKRIEEDRERHKRLRERRWVQPISHSAPASLASFLPLADADGSPVGEAAEGGEGELTLDIEFDNAWETTSEWNEDDDEAAGEENVLCFPSGEGMGGRWEHERGERGERYEYGRERGERYEYERGHERGQGNEHGEAEYGEEPMDLS